MNDLTVEEYLGYLYKKYQGEKSKNICKMLDELREKFNTDIRDVVMGFSCGEIHDLHMCLSECISYHENDKAHKKEHPDGKCPHCDCYKKLYDRIVRQCDCVDNPDSKI
ncbi:MAG: hypothetical protein IMZ52_06220 [Actinobacteria bacterium]|nr:hypothetical protein [Actinomycetota bacterium]MBE3114661.1 hypothetical protein [Actinomycetota bacterium]